MSSLFQTAYKLCKYFVLSKLPIIFWTLNIRQRCYHFYVFPSSKYNIQNGMKWRENIEFLGVVVNSGFQLHCSFGRERNFFQSFYCAVYSISPREYFYSSTYGFQCLKRASSNYRTISFHISPNILTWFAACRFKNSPKGICVSNIYVNVPADFCSTSG